jgi:hypothetical protein
MINATLTSVTGGTKVMGFATKENLIDFIDKYADILPIGKAVCIDAPLAGIHAGWIHGKATKD